MRRDQKDTRSRPGGYQEDSSRIPGDQKDTRSIPGGYQEVTRRIPGDQEDTLSEGYRQTPIQKPDRQASPIIFQKKSDLTGDRLFLSFSYAFG